MLYAMSYAEIGHESLKWFVRTVEDTINNIGFDTILAASDSGNLATYITSVIYNSTGREMPPIFVFPVFRHVDKERTILFDNTVSARGYADLTNSDLGDVLFVDDEIWRGATLRGSLDIIGALHASMGTMTVVAEDGGFNPRAVEDAYNIKIRYISPRHRVNELYNAFSYIVPDKYVEALKSTLPGGKDINHKQVMCTLLGLPIKEQQDGIPCFSHHLLNEAALKIEDFKALQDGFAEWFNSQIISSLKSGLGD
jgi:hypothetical protein